MVNPTLEEIMESNYASDGSNAIGSNQDESQSVLGSIRSGSYIYIDPFGSDNSEGRLLLSAGIGSDFTQINSKEEKNTLEIKNS